MSGSVVVIGAGAAGLAAAFGARSAGCDVTVVSSGAGATALASGALDDVPWERAAAAARVLGAELSARSVSREVVELCDALGTFRLCDEGGAVSRLATAAGRLRPARGHDRALLDLSLLSDTCVALPRAARQGWDADDLAASLSDDPFARARGLSFRAVSASVLLHEGEERVADGDLAARHDDETRLGWLAERLREALGREARAGGAAGAILLGPWLGARAPRAEALSASVGLPTGEVLVGVGGPAGLRFEAARDRLLASIGAARIDGRAAALATAPNQVAVTVGDDGEPVVAGAVVLAVGGLVGGGIAYAPPENEAGDDLPPRGRVPFALSLDAPVGFAAFSESLDVVASLHGPDLDAVAWPGGPGDGLLEAVGVACHGVTVQPGIFAAGDVVAGRPRTVIEALASGIAAGHAAARHASRG